MHRRSEQYLSFNTPVGTPEAMQCGKVVFTDIHIKQSSVGSTTADDSDPSKPFPTGCKTNEDVAAGEGARVPVLRPVVLRAARHDHARAADRAAARRPVHAAAVGIEAARGPATAAAAPAAESRLIEARDATAVIHLGKRPGRRHSRRRCTSGGDAVGLAFVASLLGAAPA